MRSCIRTTLLPVVVAIAAATFGCSPARQADPEGGPPVDRSAPWFAAVDKDLNEAKAAGAGPEQLKALESARNAGRLSFEDYNAAVDRALRCVREGGFRVFDDKVTVYQGLKMRLYSVQIRDDGTNEPVVDGCIKQHSYFVEKAYQLQPASLEAKERHFEQYRAALVNCLSGAGVAVDQQMTEIEVMQAVNEGMEKGVNCLQETGYNG